MAAVNVICSVASQEVEVKLTNPFAVDCDFSIHVVHTLAADLDLDKLKEKEKQRAGQRHAACPLTCLALPCLALNCPVCMCKVRITTPSHYDSFSCMLWFQPRRAAQPSLSSQSTEQYIVGPSMQLTPASPDMPTDDAFFPCCEA